MARSITVRVPIPPDQALSLFLAAAEALHHQIVSYDPERRLCTTRADFRFGSLATFGITAHAEEGDPGDTRLHMLVRPAFRLTPWTGVNQSEHVAWELVGKMQELHDPARYEELGSAHWTPPTTADNAPDQLSRR